MDRLEKFKGIDFKKADAVADIELINQYSRKQLKPEEVYCFSVILCDNDVDRDFERFSNSALEKLAELYVGKTGITDHFWSADGQFARLYRAEVETSKEKTRLGEPLCRLRGSAYMLRNESTQPIIDAIEGGIRKEISVGVSVEKCSCSICGETFYGNCCSNGHKKGQQYDEGLCVGVLENPLDAYEFSFVAVPAQRGAGVTKSFESVDRAFEILMTAELSEYPEKVKQLILRMQSALADNAEREEREKILAENEQYLRKSQN